METFISRHYCLLFGNTIEVFLVHMSSFPWQPWYTGKNPCAKAGMTSRTHGQIKLVKEKLPVCTGIYAVQSTFALLSYGTLPYWPVSTGNL
jgi:hypothetical protein